MIATALILTAVTAIKAARIVDPASDTVATNQVIVVENDKITAVGPNPPLPAGARVVELPGQTVLPGLIDAHTHLCATVDAKWDLGDFWIMALQRRYGFRAIQGAQHAREMLEAGFTTVRDLGNAGDYLDMDLEKSIRFGIVPGPTILPAGRIIGPFGGQFWNTPTDRKLLDNAEYAFADSRDEMRKAIRENVYWGAKVIKIVVDGKKYAYTADDIRFIVEEAGRAGLKVAAHAQTGPGAHAAIEGGVASIEHGWILSDEDLALAKTKGVALVSTDFTEKALRANGLDENAARKFHARSIERLRRAYKAGVTIVFGSDLMVDVEGHTRGQLAMEYVDSFIEAGIPPKYVLRAMTSEAARLLGVDQQRGALKPGHAADLVAVPRDPLQDLSALKSVTFVMRNGAIVKR